MEPLLNPERAEFRWWSNDWSLVFSLEEHGRRSDPHLRRVPVSFMRQHPGLRRYIEPWQVPFWDVIGWQSVAEGPWRLRRLVALFPRAPWIEEPKVLCLDGPTDSRHRNSELELCPYFVRDPDERRWKLNDGLPRLFDLARVHVWSEHIWRSRGCKKSDWPTPQAAHGYGAPAAPAPELALSPELPFTLDGHPLGVPLA